ncbi:MAG: ATP-binding protein [Bacteroidales bacterium]|nr:ATP-binding protein [Bacteroidales bacterium]
MLQTDPILKLVLIRIRLLSKRRILWLRKLWQEEGETGGQIAITHAVIDAILNEKDSPDSEYSWYDKESSIHQLSEEIALVEKKIKEDKNSRFTKLCRLFDLNQEESDLFQLCLALKLDPSLSRIYAYIQDHAARGYPTEELALRLFGNGYSSLLKTDSSLVNWQLIREKETAAGEPNLFMCDPFIVQWLLGYEGLDESLVSIARQIEPGTPLKNWAVKNTTDLLRRIMNNPAASNGVSIGKPYSPQRGGKLNPRPPTRYGAVLPGGLKDKSKRLRLIIVGPPGSGRRTFAAVLCSRFKKNLLTIDSDGNEDWHKVFMHAQRLALLDNCGIAWYGEKALSQAWPQGILSIPLQFVICEKNQKPQPVNGIIDSIVEMPEIPIAEQKKLLKNMVPVSQSWDKKAFSNLVSQHRMSIGDIKTMADRDVQIISEVSDVLHESARYKLGELAQLLECPFQRDDLILPEYLWKSLDDLIFEARERKQFWEGEHVRRLFPQGRGLIALFNGTPGTGKTMAAQVIAAELGLDLFRIDLSSVVSKYVGETSQNLDRILSRAQHMDIVLLFDEADALFGKRTEVKEAHDRFANTDTSYLLQAIENYQGIALLSSNKKENIDMAFIRRLRYVLEFPKPDAHQREQIWFKVMDRLVKPEQTAKLNGQVKMLAKNVELTGSQIKFSLLSAVFIAKSDRKPLEMAHLLRGLDRELMKEGRTMSKREREKLLGNG